MAARRPHNIYLDEIYLFSRWVVHLVIAETRRSLIIVLFCKNYTCNYFGRTLPLADRRSPLETLLNLWLILDSRVVEIQGFSVRYGNLHPPDGHLAATPSAVETQINQKTDTALPVILR